MGLGECFPGLGFVRRPVGVAVDDLPASGQLAVTEDECRDVLWSTTDGVLWYQLVERRGWSDERYSAWLGRLWVSSLLG